jgi:hypothetical protein
MREILHQLPTFLLIAYTVAILVWLGTIVLPLVAFRQCAKGTANAIRTAIILSAIAGAVAFFGATRFPVNYHYEKTRTRTVSGGAPVVERSGWRIDSRPFFVASGVLAAVALLVSIWAKSRLNSAPVVKDTAPPVSR